MLTSPHRGPGESRSLLASEEVGGFGGAIEARAGRSGKGPSWSPHSATPRPGTSYTDLPPALPHSSTPSLMRSAPGAQRSLPPTACTPKYGRASAQSHVGSSSAGPRMAPNPRSSSSTPRVPHVHTQHIPGRTQCESGRSHLPVLGLEQALDLFKPQLLGVYSTSVLWRERRQCGERTRRARGAVVPRSGPHSFSLLDTCLSFKALAAVKCSGTAFPNPMAPVAVCIQTVPNHTPLIRR